MPSGLPDPDAAVLFRAMRTFATNLVCLLMAVAVAAGCPGTRETAPPSRPVGHVVVANTTDRCLGKGRTIAVFIDGERRGVVEPGVSATHRVWAGSVKVAEGSEAPRQLRVGEGDNVLTAFGCGDASTVGGKDGAVLRLTVGQHRCEAGLYGAISWTLDGHPLARQAPGGYDRVVRVPPGKHKLEATVERVVLAQQRLDLTRDKGARAQVGCGPVGPSKNGVLPLTVSYAPPSGCAGTLRVKLAGKTVDLRPQQAFTVYLPFGAHRVQFPQQGQAETVELKTAGSVLRRAQCIETPATPPSPTPPQSPGAGDNDRENSP